MFRLLRYFSITSLIAFVIVIALLGAFYRQTAVNDLIELEESKNVALTQSFANSLWEQFTPFVSSVSGLSAEELRAHPEVTRLRQAVLNQMENLSVVKVKVYNLDGLTVFSTEASQIGDDKSTNAGYLSARNGLVATELTHRDTFSAFEETIEDRDVLSSYIPIRRGDATAPVEGVFEIYSDVTLLLDRIERTQTNVVIGVTLTLTSLYFILFLIVRHADRILQRQHIQSEQTEAALQRTSRELELRVEERTVDLKTVNEKLRTKITEHQQAEEALRESEHRYRTIVESIKDGYYEVDLSGTLTFVNASLCTILGYPEYELLGMNFKFYTGVEAAESVFRIFNSVYKTGSSGNVLDWEIVQKDKSKRQIEASVSLITGNDGDPIGFRGIVRDTTERKQTEQTLFQAQKTESLGILAGGIAHDFNNLLVSILGQTSLVQVKLPQHSPMRANIDKAVKSAERAADLAGQMLAYSGRSQFEINLIDLNSLITDNLHLFEVAIPKNIQLRSKLADALPLIEADAGQMQQVLMNLLLNAAEASDGKPGMVRLVTGTEDVETEDGLKLYTGEPLTGGRYVTLEVQDDGAGIDTDTLSKIFDPFFTTKFTGRGLGLAAVQGIVRGHRGGLLVDSQPGKGTTFKLLFPAIEDAHPDFDADSKAEATQGLILVIDDEEHVRDTVVDILDSDGLQVITAQDGAVGIEIYKQRMADIELVLLDWSMPGLGGEETLEQLRRLDPDVRVLLSSGYAQQDATRRFAGQELTGFVQKPYGALSLIDIVRQNILPIEQNGDWKSN